MIDSAVLVDIIRESVLVGVKVCAPLLITALVVGIVVSLFQALTQIQEMTLTFVPKAIAIFLVLIMTLPFMIRTLIAFAQQLFARIVTGA